MDHVELTDLRIDTIIGILDAEQRAPQPILVDLHMELPLDQAAESGQLHTSVNYAAVQAWLTTLAQQGRWRLLESLGVAACRLLLAEPAPCEARGRIRAVHLRIRKPTILTDAVPGIVMTRDHDWMDDDGEPVVEGVVQQVLCATPVQGAWRVVLDPGAAWEVPGPWSLHVLGGSGTVDGLPATEGTLHARAPGSRVVAGDEGMVVLACGAPV